MSKYIVSPVPIQLVDYLWSAIENHLARVVAIAEDEISLSSIHDKIISGKTLLLVVINRDTNIIVSAIVVEKITYENGMSALVMPIVGGDEMDGWLEQSLEVAKGIAKDIGCTELRGLGARRGWLRKLKNHGWEEAYTVIKCKLED